MLRGCCRCAGNHAIEVQLAGRDGSGRAWAVDPGRILGMILFHEFVSPCSRAGFQLRGSALELIQVGLIHALIGWGSEAGVHGHVALGGVNRPRSEPKLADRALCCVRRARHALRGLIKILDEGALVTNKRLRHLLPGPGTTELPEDLLVECRVTI